MASEAQFETRGGLGNHNQIQLIRQYVYYCAILSADFFLEKGYDRCIVNNESISK